MTDSTADGPKRHWHFVVLVAFALAAFAVLSYTAVLTKSSTYDEPMHTVAGATHRQLHDFRMNIEDPPRGGYDCPARNQRSNSKNQSADAA